MKYLLIVTIIIGCGLWLSCKPPRISMATSPGLLAGGYSRETVNGKEYFVQNSHFRPAYFDYEDWGIVVLTVADVTDRESDSKLFHISSNDEREQRIKLYVDGDVTCQWEKDCFIVCYNDKSGNCYRARLEMDDPRAACLFYDSKNKNRSELVDLWKQLNKEKDKHEMIFEAQ